MARNGVIVRFSLSEACAANEEASDAVRCICLANFLTGKAGKYSNWKARLASEATQHNWIVRSSQMSQTLCAT